MRTRLTGLATLLFSGEMAPPFAAAVVIGFVASWFAEGRFLANPRAPRIWNVVLVALLTAQVVRVVLGESPVSADQLLRYRVLTAGDSALSFYEQRV